MSVEKLSDALYISPGESVAWFPEDRYIRAEIDGGDADRAQTLTQAGFFFADRTLLTAVPLVKLDERQSRFCRFPVEAEEYCQEVMELAKIAFTVDRRFHLTRRTNMEKAIPIIEAWIDRARTGGRTLIACRYQGALVGFMFLAPWGDGGSFAELAAVRPEYQSTGVAFSLYYKTCIYCREKGDARLFGRISSANTAVLNLYAMLGASFSVPYDVYIRERKG